MKSSVRPAGPSDTPARHVEDVYSVAQGNAPPIGIEPVSASWRRSATEHRVDPLSGEAPRILLPHELKDFREPLDELIFSAQEEIDRLYRVVREAGYTVLFCDTAGVAVEHRGDDTDASRFRYWGTWLGGMWSEAMEGTNGIGTCIAEERAVTVHRGQHFRSRHIDLSCSGAPVFDVDGRLMAVLDVSAIDPQLSERAHALTGALTATAARVITRRFFQERFRREWIVAVSPLEDGEPEMLLAVDDHQRIVGANRAARTSLLLDDQRLRTGVSLWTLFERDPVLFRRRDTDDFATRLIIAGSDRECFGCSAEHNERRPARAPASECACQSEAARAGRASARRSAAGRNAPGARIRRRTPRRKHGSRGAGCCCGTIGVSLRPAIQANGRRHTALLPRTETRRASPGHVGAHRSRTFGNCRRSRLLRPESSGAPFPSNARHDPERVSLVATLAWPQAGCRGMLQPRTCSLPSRSNYPLARL